MENKKWTLYRHVSPSGKIYIGITSRNVYKRWNKGMGYESCKLFYKAILKYGWDNIKHEILFTDLEESRAKKLEIELIRHYKSLGVSYNLTNGGDGYLGYSPNEETRKKLSEASKRRVYTKLSEETRNKIREAHLKYIESYKTQEFRNKISNAVNYKKKRVIQYSLDMKYIRDFNSANEAEKATGVNRGSILRCCKGKVNRAGNYIWRFKDGI